MYHLKILTLILILLTPNLVGAQAVFPNRGGTGINNVPTYGQVLVGNSGGTYTLTSTSSLGINLSDITGTFGKTWEIVAGFLTPTTTIPVLIPYASSTYATIETASTSALRTSTSATFEWLGTGLAKITSGALGLATAGVDYVVDVTGDWTGTFDSQQGAWYIDRANHTGTQLAATISDFASTARGLLSGTSPITYDSGTGAIGLDLTQNLPWSGTGTTTYAGNLDVAGDVAIRGRLYFPVSVLSWGPVTAPYFVATSTKQASTIPYASTTALTASGSIYSNILRATTRLVVGAPTAEQAPIEVFGTDGGDFTGLMRLWDNTAIGSATGPAISFVSRLTNGPTYFNTAYIRGLKENTTSGNSAGALQFGTRTSGAGVIAERMRIDASGNVGIGTVAPGGGQNAGLTIRKAAADLITSTQSIGLAINRINSDTGAGFIGVNTSNQMLFIGNNNDLLFGEYNSGPTWSEYMRIQQDTGNVGVASSTPWKKLSVLGEFAVGGPSGNNSIYMTNTGTGGRLWRFIFSQTADTTAGGFSLFDSTAGAYRWVVSAVGNMGIATTTPKWVLNPYSATAPQLALSNGAGIIQWVMRNAGGIFYLSATDVAGTATTTTSALAVSTATTTINTDLTLTNGQKFTGGQYCVSKAVTYNGGTQKIVTAEDGEVVVDVYFRTTVTWANDLGATASIGDASTNNGMLALTIAKLIDTSQYHGADPQTRGTYLFDSTDDYLKRKAYTATTDINFYSTPGSSNAGAGIAYVCIQKLK